MHISSEHSYVTAIENELVTMNAEETTLKIAERAITNAKRTAKGDTSKMALLSIANVSTHVRMIADELESLANDIGALGDSETAESLRNQAEKLEMSLNLSAFVETKND